MHKRAVWELSRCHRIDLCAARCRCLPPAAPTLNSRRTFRSSADRHQASEAAAAAKEEQEGTASRESFPRAKWGGGWASRQPRKPAGLAVGEQAQREVLLSRSRGQEQGSTQKSSPEQKERQLRTNYEKSDGDEKLLFYISKRGGHSHDESTGPFISKRRGHSHNESTGPRRIRVRPSDRPRELQINRIPIPPALRFVDWECPECKYRCFGKHPTCTACNAVRPELQTRFKRLDLSEQSTIRPELQPSIEQPDLSEQSTIRPELQPSIKRLDLSEQSTKIRKLGQSVLADWDQLTLREKTFRDHILNKGAFAEVHPIPSASEGTNVPEAKADIPESSQEPPVPTPRPSRRRIRRPIEIQENEVEEVDEVEEDTQSRKLSTHRPVGKPRESEFEDEFDEDNSRRRRREERKRMKKEKARRRQVDAAPSPLYLPEFISVSNLADVIGVRPAHFVERMEEMGFEGVTYNHVLDAETAGLVAAEFNFEPIFEKADDDLTAAPEPEDKTVLPQRPPVVTIMGHVDHGKTTILDWLRKSSIAASEHGGITQHIGAFSVSMPSGKVITFLDTPGHAAFLDMRRRGADVTDIVVLVVAADDSVKPQTIEAIKHAKDAKVPVIVAINKIDKDNVDPEKVKQDLARHSVDVEDYGGDVQAICVSGKTGQGMLELEEAIVTLSEMLDHRADTTGDVEGWVVEATTKSSGRVATALIRRGTMRPGDIVVAGTTWARVRTLKNEAGVEIKEATPGMPVEIDGWKEQPAAGSEILQAPSEQKAKDVVEYRLERSETQKLSKDMAAINESRRELLEKRRREDAEQDESLQIDEETSGPKPIHFLIKADVSGSVEAVVNSVSAIGNNEVYASVLRSGVGPIGEFDIKHAYTAKGHVISFNTPVEPAMSRMAELHGVKIMDHNIIYELIDAVKAELSEHLPPIVSRRVTGEAEIGQIFNITVKGRETTAIAGCKVRNGSISRAKKVRVLRGQEVIYDGSLSSLKNVKKDVTEMRKDTECGLAFEGWTDFAVGDHVQCYEEISEKRYL